MVDARNASSPEQSPANILRLPDATIRRCAGEITRRMRLVAPSLDEVRTIIEKEPKLVNSLTSYDPPESDTTNADEGEAKGLDTYERDWVMDMVGNHFAGRDAPCFGTSDSECQAFVREFYAKAQAAGWTIAPR